MEISYNSMAFPSFTKKDFTMTSKVKNSGILVDRSFIPVKNLGTIQGKKEYYEYDWKNPKTWVDKPEPSLSETSLETINKELAKIAGYDIHGDQRYRAIWAVKCEQRKMYPDSNGKLHVYMGKKYNPNMYFKFRRAIGATYLNDKGQTVRATKPEDVPAGKPFTILTEMTELSILRWVIEMKFTFEELVEAKMIPAPDSERDKKFAVFEGKKYHTGFDPKGHYVLCYACEEINPDDETNGFYRDVSMADVENIKRIWQLAQTESNHEFALRKEKEVFENLARKEQKETDALLGAAQDALIIVDKMPVNREFFTPK